MCLHSGTARHDSALRTVESSSEDTCKPDGSQKGEQIPSEGPSVATAMEVDIHGSNELEPGSLSALSGNSNVQVVVRVRPPNNREREQGYQKCLAVEPGNKSLVVAGKPQSRSFTFDYVADEDTKQVRICYCALEVPAWEWNQA